MQVHRGLDHLPVFKNAVLTIGSFDGVHHGHRAIISRLVEKAEEVNGESIILTFDPHPRQVVFPNDDSLRLLNTLEEKIELLKDTGLKHLIIAPFTIEFSRINPYKYVDDILIGKIHVAHMIIGYDHRFGLNRDGDIDLLNIYARQEAFTVEEIPHQDVDHLHVSSTKIRNYLLKGDIIQANKLLDHNYSLNGVVTKGSQIAGSLGFPTANCEIKEKSKLIPGSGTYAAITTFDNEEFEGMLYIGKSPTLKSREDALIEVNLFGSVSNSLYGKKITIMPEKRFRGDQKFHEKKELLYNIQQDKIEVAHYFQTKKVDQLVTTAILNYNGQEHLETYLDSHHPSDQHVAIIDNNSEDNSISYLESAHPEIQLIKLDSNHGFSGGYNHGISEIGTKYVAIVNSDVRVTDNWLKPIIDLLENDETIAAVQPKILSLKDPDHFEYAGAGGGFIDICGYPMCRGRILDHMEKDQGQYDERTEIFWTSGAAMVIRTDLFKEAGGFDNDYFAHMEEIDLCWRLKNAGYKIYYEPSSVIYHVGGGTLDYDHPKKVFLNLRNSYWTIFRNKSISSLLFITPVRIILDSCYALLFLLKGKPGHFMTAFSGIFKGLVGIFKISRKRQENKFFTKRYGKGPQNKSGMLRIILPISYYLFHKKRFSDYQ